MHNKSTLLLNSSYEVLSIISDRRAFKLLFNDKVDIVSSWNDNVKLVNSIINTPSIVKLKKYIKRNFSSVNFTRRTLLKRDDNTCQYCGQKLILSEITIDHVIPKFLNGKTTFQNCVVCCRFCNAKKANKTIEQANMKLLKVPVAPNLNILALPAPENWHSDWATYIGNNI